MRIALICAAALAAAPISVSAQDAGRNLAASCAMCHGTTGYSVGGNEPLAGMPKDELERKFKEFRSGAKPATAMHQISKGYSDGQLAQIAAFFAAQKK
ncbi:MAG: c-type cytochrome [Proteobacteria bacterium]|nr:c-type cytochrome [Pseudomonadota bacterium]